MKTRVLLSEKFLHSEFDLLALTFEEKIVNSHYDFSKSDIKLCQGNI